MDPDNRTWTLRIGTWRSKINIKYHRGVADGDRTHVPIYVTLGIVIMNDQDRNRDHEPPFDLWGMDNKMIQFKAPSNLHGYGVRS